MYKYLVLFVLVACICVATEAQLTFTSSWGGKRSGSIAGSVSCRNDEAIAAIYKMIQVFHPIFMSFPRLTNYVLLLTKMHLLWQDLLQQEYLMFIMPMTFFCLPCFSEDYSNTLYLAG